MTIELALPATVPERCGNIAQDLVLAALGELERLQGEKIGWDQRPRLWMMDAAPDSARFTSVPPSVWGRARYTHAADALRAYARQLLPDAAVPDPLPEPVLDRYVPAAVVCMTEAWGITEDMQTDYDREVRSVDACDVALHCYRIQRTRGEEPKTLFAPSDGVEIGGTIPAALYRLALAARLGLMSPPDGSAPGAAG